MILCRDIFDPESSADFFNVDKNPHYGATCGRVAGRIAKASFTLPNGKTFKLAENNNGNSLHGGPMGYSHLEWDAANEMKGIDLDITVDGNPKKGTGVKF